MSPCVGGVPEATEASQDASTLDGDPLVRPRILDRQAEVDERPGRPPRPATEIRTPARSPPPIARIVFLARSRRDRPERIGQRIRLGECGIQAVERLL